MVASCGDGGVAAPDAEGLEPAGRPLLGLAERPEGLGPTAGGRTAGLGSSEGGLRLVGGVAEASQG